MTEDICFDQLTLVKRYSLRPLMGTNAFEHAKESLLRLDQALSEKDETDTKKDRDYTLREKIVGEIPFISIGNKQYWLKMNVNEKMNKIRIGRSSFSIEIPDYEDGKPYVFLLDAREPQKFSLSYFDQKYLTELRYDIDSQ